MKKSVDTPSANTQSELFEFNLLQLVNYFFSHRLWITVGTTLFVALAVVWVTFIRRPIYRATVTINIDLMEDKAGSNPFAAMMWQHDQIMNNKIGLVEQYFESQEFRLWMFRMMATKDVPESLQEELELIRRELIRRSIDEKDDVIDFVHGAIDLRGKSEKSSLELNASGAYPKLASAIANVGAHALTEYNRLMLVQRLKSLKGFLNQQTSQTKAELRRLEEELVVLQKRAKIISPDEVRIKVNALQVEQEAKLIEFDRQYAALNTLIAETESDLLYFKRLMQDNKPASHLYIEQIQKRLEILRYQKLQTADSPLADPTIDKMISDVAEELNKQLAGLGPVGASPWEYIKKIEVALFDLKQKRSQAKSEMIAQQAAVVRTTKEFNGLPDVLKKMSEVKRTIDLTTSLFTGLMTRLQETQIKEAAHANDLVIVSQAEPPTAPAGLGRTRTVLLAVIGGFALSCLPLFLRFVLLPTIRNVKDLKHLGVPIIGAVSWFRGNGNAALKIQLQDKCTRLLKDGPSSPEANALRFVRFQIEQFLSLRARKIGQASRVVMVGSVNPKEGRTFTAVNLAELFASSGVRVCLLDLDFSKPGLLEFFPNAANEKSPIVDVFPKECGFKMSKVDANLSLITPNPTTANMSELLETREFESALNALEVYYELIIVDTPPLNGHMEAVIAAQYADAFLLVINQRRTLRTEVEEAIRVLQSSLKLPIWGVMNFIFDEVAQGRRKGKKLEREQRRKSPPVAPPTDERAA